MDPRRVGQSHDRQHGHHECAQPKKMTKKPPASGFSDREHESQRAQPPVSR
jgi:hypothetical protein